VGGAPLAVIRQYIAKSEIRVMRKKTPSFIAEFPLSTTPADERELSIRLDVLCRLRDSEFDDGLRWNLEISIK
jgi:hypothetical protein